MQEQLEKTLSELVAIRSESNDPLACQEVIRYTFAQLEPLGLHITSEFNSDHPWLVATTQKTKKPRILLVAHLDVVPGTFRQFELKKTETQLSGRGVWDMKFAAACYIELFKEYVEHKHDLDVGIMFTTDEEIGGWHGVKALLEHGWSAGVTIIPDIPEGWKIEERAKGVAVHQLIATGTTGHGSRPWESDNALVKLLPAIQAIRRRYKNIDRSGPTLSINVIESGAAFTQVPDKARMITDFRSFTPADFVKHDSFMNGLAKKYDLEVAVQVTGEPLNLDQDNPLVQSFMRSLEHSTGKLAQFRQSYGATDGRWFALHGIPCIVVSIDGGSDFHTADEWIVRSDLSKFYNLLEHYILNNAYVKKLDKLTVKAHTR